MKKSFLIVSVVFIFFSNLTCVHAIWPIVSHTKPVEGRITDATTGQPVENVIVEPVWYWRMFAFFDGESEMTVGKLAITDKDGKYRIASKTIWCLMPSGDVGMNLVFIHPLYDRKEIGIYIHGYSDREHKVVKEYSVKIENNKAIRDVQLLSIEERYKDLITNIDDPKRLGKETFIDAISSYNKGSYFMALDNRKIKFDLDIIIDTWKNIVKKYSRNQEEYDIAIRYINNAEKGIREILKK